jgi:hypothetical protein
VRRAAHLPTMTRERRDEITALVLGVFASPPGLHVVRARVGKQHPVPYGKMVMAVQERGEYAIEEIDHVLVQLCTRAKVNLIAGELFFTGGAIAVEDPLDPDRIDWLYGTGRHAQ